MALALDWKTIFFRRDLGAAAFFRRVLPLVPAGTTYFDAPVDIAIPVGTTAGALVLYFTVTATCFDSDRQGPKLDPTSSALHLYYAELEHNTITGGESRVALDLGSFAPGPRILHRNRRSARHSTDSDWVHVSPPTVAATNPSAAVSQPRDYSCEIAWSFSPPSRSRATKTLTKPVLGASQPSTRSNDLTPQVVWKRCQVLCKRSGRIFLDITYRITFVTDVASLPRPVPTVMLGENASDSPNSALTDHDSSALGSETPSELTSDRCSQFSSLTSSQCPSSLAASTTSPKRPKGWLRRTKSVVFNQLLTKLSNASAEVSTTLTKLPSTSPPAINSSERNPALSPPPLNPVQPLPGDSSGGTGPHAIETYSEHDVHSTAFGTEVRRDYWRRTSQVSLTTGPLSDELTMSDLESDLEQSHEWEKVTPPVTQVGATIEATGQGYYRMVIPPLPFDASPGQLASSSMPRKDLFNKLGHWLYNTSPIQYFKRADLKKRLRCEFACHEPIYLLGTRYDLHETRSGLSDNLGSSMPSSVPPTPPSVSRTSSVGRGAQSQSIVPLMPDSAALPLVRDSSARRRRRASFNVLQFLKPAKTSPPIPATPLRVTSIPPSPLATLTSRPPWSEKVRPHPGGATDTHVDADQPTGRRRSSTWSWAVPRKSTPSPQFLSGLTARDAHDQSKLSAIDQTTSNGHLPLGKGATSLAQISPSAESLESGQAWTAPSGLPRRTRGKRLTILTSMLSPKSPTPTHSLRSAPLLESKCTGGSGHAWGSMLPHQSLDPHNGTGRPPQESRRPPLMPNGPRYATAVSYAAPAMAASPLQRPPPSVPLGSIFSPVDSKSSASHRLDPLPPHVHSNPDEASDTTVPFPALSRKNAKAMVDSLAHFEAFDHAPRRFPIQLAHGWYHPLPPELAAMWTDTNPPPVSKAATQRLALGAATPTWLVQEQAGFFRRHGFDVGSLDASTLVARQHGNWSSFPWRDNTPLKRDQDIYCLPLATYSLVVKVLITFSQPSADEERHYRCDASLGQTLKHPPDLLPNPAGSTVCMSLGVALYAECYGVVKVRCHPTQITPETDSRLTLQLVQAFEQTMRALRIDWQHKMVQRFESASQASSFACRELYHRQSVNFGALEVPLNQPAFASSLAPALAQAISGNILPLHAPETRTSKPRQDLPSLGPGSPASGATASMSWQSPGQVAGRSRKPSPVPSHLGIGHPIAHASQAPANAAQLLANAAAIDHAEPRRWEPISTHQLSLPTVSSLFAANFGLRTLVSLQDTVSMMGLSRAPFSPMTPPPVVCQTPSPLANKVSRHTMKRTWSDQFTPLRLRGKASPSSIASSNQSTPTPLPWTTCEPPGHLDQLPSGFEDFGPTGEHSTPAPGALSILAPSEYSPSQRDSDSGSHHSSPPTSHSSRERAFSPLGDAAESTQANVLSVLALRPGHPQPPGLRALEAFISHFATVFYFTYQTNFAAIPTTPAHVQDYVLALNAKPSFATTSSSRTDQGSSSSALPSGKLPAVVGAGNDPPQAPGGVSEGHFMSSYTSDSGWGCMHRTSQMMLANAFAHIMLGLGWRTRPSWHLAAEQVAAYLSIASWFSSDYQPTSHYSIQRMSLEGVQHPFEVPIGGWFGPSVAAHVLKRLALAHDQCPAHVDVCPDQMVIPEKILGMLPTLPSRTAPDLKPVLLLLPVRLGVDRLNPLYYDNLRHLFTMPQFVGIAGGQPSKSLFFVGCQGSDLLYLDPHVPQPYHPVAINSSAVSGIVPLPHLHTRGVRSCAIGELDPSMLLGFVFHTAADFCAWWHGELGAWPNPKVPLFSVAKPRQDMQRSKSKTPQPWSIQAPTNLGRRDPLPAFSEEPTGSLGPTPELSLSAQHHSRRLPRSPSESYLKVASQMQGLSTTRAHRQGSAVLLSQVPTPCPQRLNSASEMTTLDSLVSPLARKALRPFNHQPMPDAAATPLSPHPPTTAPQSKNAGTKKRAHRQSMPSHAQVRQLTTK
ncbi:hypothetical protein H4R35_001145 [Dimargaris xerosporica]|nr:hypothetical protein H4R35_001145 [Dimargaris xerosporica]